MLIETYHEFDLGETRLRIWWESDRPLMILDGTVSQHIEAVYKRSSDKSPLGILKIIKKESPMVTKVEIIVPKWGSTNNSSGKVIDMSLDIDSIKSL